MTTPWPRTLRFQRGAARLVMEFSDEAARAVSFRTMRENSPSAAHRGHGSGPPPPRPPIAPDITVERAEPVGRYAVRIVFSDGHQTGLYTWSLLHDLSAPVT